MTAALPIVAQKTTTTIQAGSKYKERFTFAHPLPTLDIRIVFLDSAGGEIATVVGEQAHSNYWVSFDNAYSEVEQVPNGAGFYLYGNDGDDDHMLKYGTAFRKQLTFPDSPAAVSTFEPKRYLDTFQRPPGALGGKWKNLVGRPLIFANTPPLPNSVGPDFIFFERFATRYYQPFNGDSVDLSLNLISKGNGWTTFGLCSNSDASSFLYLKFDALTDMVGLGIGSNPDPFLTDSFEQTTDDFPLTVSNTVVTNYKLTYDDSTKELAFYNSNKTTKYLSWVDEDDRVPHGKGYRYFGFGAVAGLLDTGVQVSRIEATDIV